MAKQKNINLERRAAIGRERRARTRTRILTAAFEVFGHETGLSARIEDITNRAGMTRATFYNHFSDMDDLREALVYEVTHDFLAAVITTINKEPDARKRSADALRFYLHRAREDRRWGWSMINISATTMIFGAETYVQAESTIREGMDSGDFAIPSSRVGRDLLLGGCLAAMGTIVREKTEDNYPEIVAGYILLGLGVPYDAAREIAHTPLPDLLAPEEASPDQEPAESQARPD